MPMSPELKADFLEYVGVACELVEDRLGESALTDFAGGSTTGLNFDLGAWDDHPEMEYSGYTGETSPLGLPPMPADDVGWDVSHARRFVQVFESLHRRRGATGQRRIAPRPAGPRVTARTTARGTTARMAAGIPTWQRRPAPLR